MPGCLDVPVAGLDNKCQSRMLPMPNASCSISDMQAVRSQIRSSLDLQRLNMSKAGFEELVRPFLGLGGGHSFD